jgi:hypothetical protein
VTAKHRTPLGLVPALDAGRCVPKCAVCHGVTWQAGCASICGVRGCGGPRCVDVDSVSVGEMLTALSRAGVGLPTPYLHACAQAGMHAETLANTEALVGTWALQRTRCVQKHLAGDADK